MHHSGDMLNAIKDSDPGKLSDECYSESLIAGELCEDVHCSGQTEREQATQLWIGLRKSIEVDETDQKFKKLCNIMYKCEKLRPLCHEIVTKYLGE